MTESQLFEPFNEQQQAEYAEEAMRIYDAKVVRDSMTKWRGYSSLKKEQILSESSQIYLDIVKAMPAGPASPQIQSCIARWHHHIHNFWVPSDEQLLALARGYNTDPRFKINFDKIDPNLAEFIAEAVDFYIRNKNKE